MQLALVLVALVLEAQVRRTPGLSPLLLGVTDRHRLILGRVSHCCEGVWPTAGSATESFRAVSCMANRVLMQHVVVVYPSCRNMWRLVDLFT